MVYAVLAWLAAAVCVAVSFARAARVARLGLPTAAELVARVENLVPRGDRWFRERARAELDELLLDVDRETQLVAEVPRALARIALGAGTALAILAFLRATDRLDVAAPGLAFVGGVVGAMVVAQIGRAASAGARRARAHWSDTVAAAWSRLSGDSTHPAS